MISEIIQSGEDGVTLEVIISPQLCMQMDVSYPMLLMHTVMFDTVW